VDEGLDAGDGKGGKWWGEGCLGGWDSSWGVRKGVGGLWGRRNEAGEGRR